MRFHPFSRRVRTHNAQTERVLWARIFCFFLNEEENKKALLSGKKKKKLSPTPEFLSLSLALSGLLKKRVWI